MRICLSCTKRFESDDWSCDRCGFTPEFHQGHPVFAPELARSNTGYHSEYFEQFDSCFERSFWIVARNRIFLWAMRRYFPKADSFLEIGCATGMVLSEFRREFPQLRVAGTEIFIEGLDEVPNRVRDAFVFQADARHFRLSGSLMS